MVDQKNKISEADLSTIPEKYKHYLNLNLNGYTIVKFLGEGAMGLVFKAFDKDLERNVALKIIKKDVLEKSDEKENTDLFKRFKLEAKNIAKLDHQNIVKIYKIGEYEEIPYISMEYVHGQKLSDIIDRCEKIYWLDALKIVYYIAQGLHYCHTRHVIHRDIKPANVMIENGTGNIKIVDYGLSKYISNNKFSDITHKGDFVGTPKYLAPCLWESPENVSDKCDIYSLGVLLYEMINFGKFPYKLNENENELIALIKLYTSKNKLNFIRLNIDDFNNDMEMPIMALNDMISKMLEKSPSNRFGAEDVMDYISNIFKSLNCLEYLYNPMDVETVIKHGSCQNESFHDIIKNVEIVKEKMKTTPFIQPVIESDNSIKDYIDKHLYKRFLKYSGIIFGLVVFFIFIYFVLRY